MQIGGLQKLSLLDYPEKTCAVVFTVGCNLRCPFCHNTTLFEKPDEIISQEEFFSFLKTRRGLLDGVCVTGGEPLLQKDLKEFIAEIKSLGFSVKLDTNGCFPDKLKELVPLVDYIAMDIKNTKEKYALTCGTESINTENIQKSIDLIRAFAADYEFRTTVVKELHEVEDIKKIGQWLCGSKRYCIQNFRDTQSVAYGNLHGFSDSELQKMLEETASSFSFVSVK